MEMPLMLSGFPESFYFKNSFYSRTKKPITQAQTLEVIGFYF
ncbi:hypothetical protein HMPREF9954_0761 [Streptococcus infantis SK970]|nr:hypothetical protein HMPREF9954_0761 [Streptococcus infantis SK970]